MSTIVLVAGLLLVAYVALAFVAWRFGDRMTLPAPPASYLRGSLDRELTIRTSDGVELSAVYLPNDPATYTILYSHGNGEDLGNLLPVLELLRDLGFGVFAYDYRGYGASGGSPRVDGILLDVDAAYAHLTRELGIPAERVILWGRSVGGGPSVHLASRAPIAGMVLEATFTSAFCVVTRRRLLWWDRLCNEALLKEVHVPMLFMHGRKDRVVPFSHGVRLHHVANEPKRAVWVDEAGHNDLWLVAPDRLAREVRAFADALSVVSDPLSG